MEIVMQEDRERGNVLFKKGQKVEVEQSLAELWIGMGVAAAADEEKPEPKAKR